MALSFERDGLTEARAHLLWVLRAGPVTQRQLADALGVTFLVDDPVASVAAARESSRAGLNGPEDSPERAR